MIWSYITTFLLSMVPVLELRFAIPWGIFMCGIPPIAAAVIAVVGNILPVPFIFLFSHQVLVWGKDKKYIGKFFTFCLNKGHKAGEKLRGKTGWGLFIGLMLFVGLPLPGTGAWTGTMAASILDLNFKKSMLAIALGVIIAGVLVTLASCGLLGVFNAIFANGV